MALTAGVWKANLNGTEAELQIGMPNQQGIFVGQLTGINFRGFGDEASQTIAFALAIRVDATRDDGTPIIASFRGHLFRSPPNPEPGRDLIATLTGSYQMSAATLGTGTGLFPSIGSSRRNVFGWLAQIIETQ